MTTTEYRALETELLDHGFILARAGVHRVWRRGACIVVLPCTPGHGRSYLNDRANVRRAIRHANGGI